MLQTIGLRGIDPESDDPSKLDSLVFVLERAVSGTSSMRD